MLRIHSHQDICEREPRASKGKGTLVRRRWHSLQAVDALRTLHSSATGPAGGVSNAVLGAIGRKGLGGA